MIEWKLYFYCVFHMIWSWFTTWLYLKGFWLILNDHFLYLSRKTWTIPIKILKDWIFLVFVSIYKGKYQTNIRVSSSKTQIGMINRNRQSNKWTVTFSIVICNCHMSCQVHAKFCVILCENNREKYIQRIFSRISKQLPKRNFTSFIKVTATFVQVMK